MMTNDMSRTLKPDSLKIELDIVLLQHFLDHQLLFRFAPTHNIFCDCVTNVYRMLIFNIHKY